MIIKRHCSWCKKVYTIEVDKRQYDRWRKGAFVQVAFPDKDAGFREQIISGIHTECFDEMCADDDDELFDDIDDGCDDELIDDEREDDKLKIMDNLE